MVPNRGIELSPALQAAQENLLRLREAQRASRQDSERPSRESPSNSHPPFDCLDTLVPAGEAALAHHLGWESAPLTAALRTSRAHQASLLARQGPADLTWLADLANRWQAPPAPAASPALPEKIKLQPDLALGMLRQEMSAAGRIWLLLRVIDTVGQGWVELTEARAQLTHKDSLLRVCGWRQLRNLLAQGDDIFWQRRDGRIWLRSVVKVAAALDVWHLSSRPVALPVALLTEGIGTVRAHLYASFHSGRAKKNGSMPIARDTLSKLCRISRRSQRNYEKIARVRRQRNFAVGPKAQHAHNHEAAWRHGRALFQLRDQKGKLGTKETSYLAWQLPNSYFGPHVPQPRGQRKRLNQKLADLSMQGMTGNGKQLVDSDRPRRIKRFYGSGRQAVKAYCQPAKQDVYWCHSLLESSIHSQFWHCLPGKP